jgi:hypothetical protein
MCVCVLNGQGRCECKKIGHQDAAETPGGTFSLNLRAWCSTGVDGSQRLFRATLQIVPVKYVQHSSDQWVRMGQNSNHFLSVDVKTHKSTHGGKAASPRHIECARGPVYPAKRSSQRRYEYAVARIDFGRKTRIISSDQALYDSSYSLPNQTKQ